ncbi:MAG TPA: MFS transporter [Aggregatilineales bacterium]|nr:MFS transporter [Anaerolineales bacterium]HRE46481.1 MFS transporter [Aggregatilineales bacterium]
MTDYHDYDDFDGDDPDATNPNPVHLEKSNLDSAGEILTVASSLTGQTLRSLFGNRNFVPLWLGQLVSYLGDQFMLIAVLAVLGKLTGGNTLALVVFAVSLAAPQILFGLIGGVLTDKLDRKWTMIVTDAARAGAMFSMLLVQGQPDRIWIFYPAIFVIGTAQMLFYPARASALPSIIPKRDLAAANALLEAGFVVALIFGSGAAGLLVENLGENFAFLFNGFAFLFSALMILIIRIPRRDLTGTGGSYRQVWAELVEGLRYIWQTRSMRYIMGLSIMVAAGLGAVVVLVFEYLNKELGIGADGFGAVIGILGVGIVIGGILIQRLSKFLPTNRLVALAIFLQGVAVAAFVFNPPFLIVLLLTALIGFSLIVARAVLSTLTQAIPPEEYRGRVQSAFNLIFSAPLTLAIGAASAVISFVPRGVAVIFFGVILMLTAWFAASMLRGVDEAIYGG